MKRNQEVFLQHWNIQLSSSDIEALIKGGYITKKILDFYVNYLNEKNKILNLNRGVFIFHLETDLIQRDFSNNSKTEQLCKQIKQKLPPKLEFRFLSRVIFVVEKESSKYLVVELIKHTKGTSSTAIS